MDSLAFLPLRCPSNSLIMESFYILVLIYASCGTLWICWLSPVPSRPLVWTCCKSFHVLYAFIFPTIGQNVLWSCFFIILHIVIYRFCLKIDLQCDQKKSSRSQFFPVNKKNTWSCILIIALLKFYLYRIFSYSFHGNYSFLNLEIQRSQYIRLKVRDGI